MKERVKIVPCNIFQDAAAEMVVMCCRFLCYFCRTSGQNQRAMFEHLSYLLDNSSMLLGRISFTVSCDFCRLLITFANSLEPDQTQQNVGPDLDPNCLTP